MLTARQRTKPTQQTYTTDLHNRPTQQTYTTDLHNRPTQQTNRQ